MPRSYKRAINEETMNLSAPDKNIPTGSLQISNEWLATKRTNVNFLLEIVLCIFSCSWTYFILVHIHGREIKELQVLKPYCWIF